jgi:hypothetical protein
VTGNLGTGNDSAVISTIGPDVVGINDNNNAPRSVGIDIAGGDGRDSLLLNFVGELTSPMRVILDGGEGNDAIDAVFALASTNDYSLLAHVLGGKGNDNLGLHVKVSRPGQNEIHDLLLDGGDGFNKVDVTDNVVVVNGDAHPRKK